MKKELRGIDPVSKPSGDGCVECLASPEGWWFHLRRCAECGHIGCCDSSPSQHASKHASTTGHQVIASFEPGEDWFYDYEKRKMIRGVKLLPHVRIRRINHHQDRQGEFQGTGNHCCTSWRRSILMRWSGTRETVLVMSTVSKGAIK
ncbi:MAG: UBP-type zinc finger domain-containing protein [Terriglobales bacterium]